MTWAGRNEISEVQLQARTETRRIKRAGEAVQTSNGGESAKPEFGQVSSPSTVVTFQWKSKQSCPKARNVVQETCETGTGLGLEKMAHEFQESQECPSMMPVLIGGNLLAKRCERRCCWLAPAPSKAVHAAKRIKSDWDCHVNLPSRSGPLCVCPMPGQWGIIPEQCIVP